MIGTILRCQRCGAETAARVSLFHSMHPAGLWVGWAAFACAAAAAVWVAWRIWNSDPAESGTEPVIAVVYAACVALVAGAAMVWRYRAATRVWP